LSDLLNEGGEVEKLPKLYAPVKIRFWTLRNAIGMGGGIIYDCDAPVNRICRRVKCGDSWKWQIVNFIKSSALDCTLIQDQEVLNNNGSELDFEYI
jgi:hypothetical protein